MVMQNVFHTLNITPLKMIWPALSGRAEYYSPEGTIKVIIFCGGMDQNAVAGAVDDHITALGFGRLVRQREVKAGEYVFWLVDDKSGN